jgi:hypothetical protein
LAGSRQAGIWISSYLLNELLEMATVLTASNMATIETDSEIISILTSSVSYSVLTHDVLPTELSRS